MTDTYTDEYGDTYEIPTDEDLRNEAASYFKNTDEFSIDNDAPISRANPDSPGAWVQCWLWIDYKEVTTR